MRRRGLSGLVDDVADVRTAVLARLARSEFDNLRRYLAQRSLTARPQSFDSWLYGTVDYAIREHLRQRYGRAAKPPLEGRPDESAPHTPTKRELNTQAELWDENVASWSGLGALGVTTKLSVASILRYMEQQFSARERDAMYLHYAEDQSFAAIAERLGMRDGREAEKLIRRLNARLRHRFA